MNQSESEGDIDLDLEMDQHAWRSSRKTETTVHRCLIGIRVIKRETVEIVERIFSGFFLDAGMGDILLVPVAIEMHCIYGFFWVNEDSM